MRYTFAFLRDYFSARGLLLGKIPGGYYLSREGEILETFKNLREVTARAGRGD